MAKDTAPDMWKFVRVCIDEKNNRSFNPSISLPYACVRVCRRQRNNQLFRHELFGLLNEILCAFIVIYCVSAGSIYVCCIYYHL